MNETKHDVTLPYSGRTGVSPEMVRTVMERARETKPCPLGTSGTCCRLCAG
jgi:hypothetical protein